MLAALAALAFAAAPTGPTNLPLFILCAVVFAPALLRTPPLREEGVPSSLLLLSLRRDMASGPSYGIPSSNEAIKNFGDGRFWLVKILPRISVGGISVVSVCL
jgi:hypothetical protein